MLLFLIMGLIVLASIDQIPFGLIDNAIILGLMSILVAFIFLVDLSDPLAMRRRSTTQTEIHSTSETGTQANQNSESIPPPQNHHRNLQREQPQLHFKQKELPQIPERKNLPTIPPGKPSQGIVKLDTLPKAEQPVFGTLLCPEKTRAQKNKVNTKGAFIVEDVNQNRDQIEDDTMSRISANSYVKNIEVDEIPGRSSRTGNDETDKGCDEIKAPISTGFVVHAAKMWDSRTKPPFQPKTFGANTRV